MIIGGPNTNPATLLHMSPHLLGSLSFLRSSQESMLFILCTSIPGMNSTDMSSIDPLSPEIFGTSSTPSVALTQDVFHVVDQFKQETESTKSLESYILNAKAFIPESVFAGNPEDMNKMLLEGQASSAMDFLKLITYLISNNFSAETEVISKHIYKGVKSPLTTGLLKYLFSIDGDTTEKLASNLFTLAIDASDFDMVKKLIKWGINPNEIAYSSLTDEDFTPLQHACRVQIVEVVQALIDGGAGRSINVPAGKNNILSIVIQPELAYKLYHNNRPRDSTEDGRYHEEQVKTELIQILLRAGAAVNPNHGIFPLAMAAELGKHWDVSGIAQLWSARVPTQSS